MTTGRINQVSVLWWFPLQTRAQKSVEKSREHEKRNENISAHRQGEMGRRWVEWGRRIRGRRMREGKAEGRAAVRGRQAAVVWWEGARGGQMSPLPTTHHHHRNRRQPTQLSSPTTTHPTIHPPHPSIHQHIHPHTTAIAHSRCVSLEFFSVVFRGPFLSSPLGPCFEEALPPKRPRSKVGKSVGYGIRSPTARGARGTSKEGGGDPPPHPRHRPRRAHSLPRLVFHILPLTTAGPAGG